LIVGCSLCGIKWETNNLGIQKYQFPDISGVFKHLLCMLTLFSIDSLMKYIIMLSLLSCQFLFGQSSQDYLKTRPYLTNDTPDWAVEMYKENPNVLNLVF